MSARLKAHGEAGRDHEQHRGEVQERQLRSALHNPPELVAWRTDKAYLGELAGDLMAPHTPAPEQVALGGDVLAWLGTRFGAPRSTPAPTSSPAPDGSPLVLEIELVQPSL